MGQTDRGHKAKIASDFSTADQKVGNNYIQKLDYLYIQCDGS